MPRVETIIEPEQAAERASGVKAELVFLRPHEISPHRHGAENARPGPAPEAEDKSIQALADSFRAVGQLLPLAVEHYGNYFYLVDGRRRLAAARLLDTDEHPFRLACSVIQTEDPLRAAVHANLKRRGLTPLQFAYLCEHLRKENGWEGSKKVAEYLGVSRAQVSQHDKLLHKPEGMDKATYEELLGKVGSGRMGADAAFYALTHVEPDRAAKVLERAEAIAVEEAGTQGTPQATDQPRPRKRRETASQKTAPASKRAEKPVRISRKALQQAAREEKAIKSDLSKSIPELRVLLEKMAGTAYPDVMRNAITTVGVWMRGDTTEKDVLTHWTQVAVLVEQQLERERALKTHKTHEKGKVRRVGDRRA